MKKKYLLLLLILVSNFSLFAASQPESQQSHLLNTKKTVKDFNLSDYQLNDELIEEETSEIPAQITEEPAVTDYDFIIDYYKTIESSLNRSRRTGKLGKQTISGLKSGSFYYRCRLTGWDKVTVTMIYDNYCDFDYSISGTTTIEINWSANGTMKGTIYANGPVIGQITYDLILTKGVETGGFYYMDRTENDFQLRIPTSLFLSVANRDIELDERCTAN